MVGLSTARIATTCPSDRALSGRRRLSPRRQLGHRHLMPPMWPPTLAQSAHARGCPAKLGPPVPGLMVTRWRRASTAGPRWVRASLKALESKVGGCERGERHGIDARRVLPTRAGANGRTSAVSLGVAGDPCRKTSGPGRCHTYDLVSHRALEWPPAPLVCGPPPVPPASVSVPMKEPDHIEGRAP